MTTAANPCNGKIAITITSAKRLNAASMAAILEEVGGQTQLFSRTSGLLLVRLCGTMELPGPTSGAQCWTGGARFELDPGFSMTRFLVGSDDR